MALDRIRKMLSLCSTDKPLLPPTDLYNEGWMLRLILDWFSREAKGEQHPPVSPLKGGILQASTLKGGVIGEVPTLNEGNMRDLNPQSGEMKIEIIFRNEKWYSEALLPSAFLPRYRGDQYAESWTHADGVIGDFKIGANGAGDLSLLPDAGHFVVLEAKMFSKLSAGVTHARYYNQAARTVACMAEVLKRANRKPSEFTRLFFFVIAPQQQIRANIFERHMTRESIFKTVQRRVDEYDAPKEDWFKDWFLPTLEKITLDVMSWEEILDYISEQDSNSGEELNEFYAHCIRFNKRDYGYMVNGC